MEDISAPDVYGDSSSLGHLQTMSDSLIGPSLFVVRCAFCSERLDLDWSALTAKHLRYSDPVCKLAISSFDSGWDQREFSLIEPWMTKNDHDSFSARPEFMPKLGAILGGFVKFEPIDTTWLSHHNLNYGNNRRLYISHLQDVIVWFRREHSGIGRHCSSLCNTTASAISAWSGDGVIEAYSSSQVQSWFDELLHLPSWLSARWNEAPHFGREPVDCCDGQWDTMRGRPVARSVEKIVRFVHPRRHLVGIDRDFYVDTTGIDTEVVSDHMRAFKPCTKMLSQSLFVRVCNARRILGARSVLMLQSIAAGVRPCVWLLPRTVHFPACCCMIGNHFCQELLDLGAFDRFGRLMIGPGLLFGHCTNCSVWKKSCRH